MITYTLDINKVKGECTFFRTVKSHGEQRISERKISVEEAAMWLAIAATRGYDMECIDSDEVECWVWETGM